MSDSKLPERPSLEYLKKLAKERLQTLRQSDSDAKLAAALLDVAREHGFPSWRALKAEVDRRQSSVVEEFFAACEKGDVATLRTLIAADPNLVRQENPNATHHGWTALHESARRGHAELVRILLAAGADPNAREAGDNTYALHWAAANGDVELVRTLLDAGQDPHGFGDLHALDIIGWATYFHQTGRGDMHAVVALLVERGARHHIFSAMSIGDLALIRNLVEHNPDMLDRRLSRFDEGLAPLHLAIRRKRYDILDLLIALGADVDAGDQYSRTPLALAMLTNDVEAMRRLQAAGARPPATVDASNFNARIAKLGDSVRGTVSMISVPDVARTLDWYTAIGFRELNRWADGGLVNFGIVGFGKAELMFTMHGKPGEHEVSIWFYTNHVDELYQLLKARQMEAAQARLAAEGSEAAAGVEFVEDISDTFYNARQFAIRDLNGYVLYFIQSMDD